MERRLKVRLALVSIVGCGVIGAAAIYFWPEWFLFCYEELFPRRVRYSTNEASAIGGLRTINTAAITYSAEYAKDIGYPPTLAALGPPADHVSNSCDKSNLIDDVLSSGMKSGYIIEYRAGPTIPATLPGCPPVAKNYIVQAYPEIYSKTGTRSFYTDQSGLIRYTDEARHADATDPVLQ